MFCCSAFLDLPVTNDPLNLKFVRCAGADLKWRRPVVLSVIVQSGGFEWPQLRHMERLVEFEGGRKVQFDRQMAATGLRMCVTVNGPIHRGCRPETVCRFDVLSRT